MLVIGTDPGTGSSSPSGFVAFDSTTKNLLFTRTVGSKHRKTEHRIKEISDAIEDALIALDADAPLNATVLFCIEDFVMRGKGGVTLQRLIGSLIGRVPYRFEVRFVQNTRMKNLIGGHGQAEKIDVAHGCLHWFAENKASQKMVANLIANKEWDMTDALGLAIAGYEMEIA